MTAVTGSELCYKAGAEKKLLRPANLRRLCAILVGIGYGFSSAFPVNFRAHDALKVRRHCSVKLCRTKRPAGQSCTATAPSELSMKSIPAGVLPENSAEEVYHNAVAAGLRSLRSTDNTSTILLPTGAGDVVVGLRILKEVITPESTFCGLVVLPQSLLGLAEEMYSNAFTPDVQVVNFRRRHLTVRQVSLLFKQAETQQVRLVFLSRYEDLIMLGTARLQAKMKTPMDLIVFEAAHILRAGGYRVAGVDDTLISAKHRLYLSARSLIGRAPGALLAPGQEPGYPAEKTRSAFGDEVYRLSRGDAEQLKLTVPVRLRLLQSTNASDVADELVALHRSLGIKTFDIVPPQPRLAKVLNDLLRQRTEGVCTARTWSNDTDSSIEAVLVAGSMPSCVKLVEEFPRLARWADGKQTGLLLVAAAARDHTVAAWRALAIEDEQIERGIQRATVEAGNRDRRLTFSEVPFDMRNVFHGETLQEQAEAAVDRAVKALGDLWDLWLGRLAAHRDRYGHVKVRYLKTINGHELGSWVKSQREFWENGALDTEKVSRLKAMGFVLDLDTELFAQGLTELRKFVRTTKRNSVPLSYKTESGFMLGEWVVKQRTLLRRGRLSLRRQQLLKEAFFLFRPSEAPTDLFEHAEDPEVAELTRSIEAELREVRWRPPLERRRFFRSMVLKHHPDLSKDVRAPAAILFLAKAKEWFLAGH